MITHIDIVTHICGGNMSVVNNTSKPESTFKKKKNLCVVMLYAKQWQWESPLLLI